MISLSHISPPSNHYMFIFHIWYIHIHTSFLFITYFHSHCLDIHAILVASQNETGVQNKTGRSCGDREGWGEREGRGWGGMRGECMWGRWMGVCMRDTEWKNVSNEMPFKFCIFVSNFPACGMPTAGGTQHAKQLLITVFHATKYH